MLKRGFEECHPKVNETESQPSLDWRTYIMPSIARGRCQIIEGDPRKFGKKIYITYAHDPSEDQDQALRNNIDCINRVKEALEQDLKISLASDIESCILSCICIANTDKDANSIIDSLEDIEGLDELRDMVGFKHEEIIKLYPVSIDKSLKREGWMEISVSARNQASYSVEMLHMSSTFDSIFGALNEIRNKATQVVQAIESKASNVK